MERGLSNDFCLPEIDVSESLLALSGLNKYEVFPRDTKLASLRGLRKSVLCLGEYSEDIPLRGLIIDGLMADTSDEKPLPGLLRRDFPRRAADASE
mmetsp:Transcript_1470/g.2138  ORF Transcript_1470/g.2138 Transcript_1470/m.2138 type:complete len:96 (-) Transcript_1470:647-934(-)